jgi:hypothetical protein|tara:strand:+ start:1057 stop:1248 length:192 start_codon:yes stop_codon:yes gene_type:complete
MNMCSKTRIVIDEYSRAIEDIKTHFTDYARSKEDAAVALMIINELTEKLNLVINTPSAEVESD